MIVSPDVFSFTIIFFEIIFEKDESKQLGLGVHFFRTTRNWTNYNEGLGGTPASGRFFSR